MASVESSGKTAPAPSPPAKLLCTELVLRLLLFAVSLSALVVLVTAKQTVMVPVVLTPPFRLGPVPAQFKDSPALIYLLVALCITCLYSLLTAACSFKSRGSSGAKRIFVLILLDVVYAAIMASATGTAGAVAWVGLKGNEHTRWNKICNIYDKFCRHIGTSTFLGLFASILLVLLAVLNAHTLYRRSR
ncbi:unnamed protein product [Alopecurus aequalis]